MIIPEYKVGDGTPELARICKRDSVRVVLDLGHTSDAYLSVMGPGDVPLDWYIRAYDNVLDRDKDMMRGCALIREGNVHFFGTLPTFGGPRPLDFFTSENEYGHKYRSVAENIVQILNE